MGLKVGIQAVRLGFGSQGLDLASRCGFGPQGWVFRPGFGPKAGFPASKLGFGPQGRGGIIRTMISPGLFLLDGILF